MNQFMSRREQDDCMNICECIKERFHSGKTDGAKHYCVVVSAKRKNQCFEGKDRFWN